MTPSSERRHSNISKQSMYLIRIPSNKLFLLKFCLYLLRKPGRFSPELLHHYEQSKGDTRNCERWGRQCKRRMINLPWTSAPGLTPISHNCTRIDKEFLSRPVLRSVEISCSAVWGNRVRVSSEEKKTYRVIFSFEWAHLWTFERLFLSLQRHDFVRQLTQYSLAPWLVRFLNEVFRSGPEGPELEG